MATSEKDKRKLMQIGFAALMARKLEPVKQYIFERRKHSGFIFEPVLRNNEATLDQGEYMKKKYYSQVVYEAAQAGDLDTSIDEPNVDKKAARRLWAGKTGTGWAGTGKGGYMKDLDPGVRKFKADKGNVDELMQMYLQYQADKMLVLRKKSHESTVDLFRRVANASSDNIPPDLTFQNYIPAQNEMGVDRSQVSAYLRPFAGNDTPPRNASMADQKQYVLDAVRRYQTKYRDSNPTLDVMGHLGADPSSIKSYFGSPMGDADGRFAQQLASLQRGELDSDDYQRLTAGSRFVNVGGLRGRDYAESFKDVGTHVRDYFDAEGVEGNDELTREFEEARGYQNFKGEGGTLQMADGEFIELPKPLVSEFKRESIQDKFPLAYQQYKKDQIDIRNMRARSEGQLLNQRTGAAEVLLDNEAEVRKFIRWMEFELNKEQLAQNTYFSRPGKGILQGSNIYKKDGGLMGTPGGMGYARDSLGEFKRGLKDVFNTLEQSLSQGGIQGEIVQGFLGDFGILSDEYGYKMNQYWDYIKGDPSKGENPGMGWKYESRLKRGVDMYFPLQTKKGAPGLIQVKVRASVEAGTDPQKMPSVAKPGAHRSYVKLIIQDINYLPDLPFTIGDIEVGLAKDEQAQKAFEAITNEIMTQGVASIYQGGAMMTHTGVGTRMFMGDRSPVNSVAFFTSTVSTGDFADRLQFLVNEAASGWFGAPDGFGGYFDLSQTEGGAFKEWAMKWDAESKQLEKDINKRIAMKWEMWLDQYAGGGVTAAPPSIAKSWGGPIKLGPFVHSTKYFGQAQSVGRRPHGYYVHGDFEGGPLVG